MLKKWIAEYLLPRHFFNFTDEPSRLVLVLAMEESLDFSSRWPRSWNKVVVPRNKMSVLEKSCVEQLARALGLSSEEANHIYGLVKARNLTPFETRAFMEMFVTKFFRGTP